MILIIPLIKCNISNFFMGPHNKYLGKKNKFRAYFAIGI